ncbi:MAG: tetratricopeptide repeat protein [Rhizobiaceae bacterium]
MNIRAVIANWAFLATTAGAVFLWASSALAQKTPDRPDFVNSSTCISCHKSEHESWKKSHHSWALKSPDVTSVLGNFDNTTFLHKGVTSRFYRENDEYFIEQVSWDQAPRKYQIKYTVGVEPLQQYLVELPGGKLQALDISWDTVRKQWFHLYPDQSLPAGDGLHWTGPYKNWNARCAVCHQTNFRKNYDPRKQTYDSQWSEPTVTCQACHGPAEAHLKWSQQPGIFDPLNWKGINDKGFMQSFSRENPQQEIEVCAQCHSRRGTFGANSPPPANRFPDHHRLALLSEGLYFPDGQINDEVYVYGSFLQSKMYARGVRCSNCHEPHSGGLKAEGNAVCTQCHSEAGNSKFPTLKKVAYDDPSHHHHETGSKGAQCVSCHMPDKTYMQVDPRRDHSFRIPRPDLSAKLQTPNACTSCHQDKQADWAVGELRDWLGGLKQSEEHFGEVIQAGRSQPNKANRGKLLELALDTTRPAIVRATALSTLQAARSPETISQVAPLLKDGSHLVRSAALSILSSAPASVRIQLAFASLSDPIRRVRLEAARIFLSIPPQQIAPPDRNTIAKAMVEYQQSLLANADFPEVQMQLAGVAMTVRQFPAAQQALKTAVSMDPQLTQAWQTLARIQAALGQQANAVATLESALQNNSGNGKIQFQLGVAYAQSGDHARAVQTLERSIQFAADKPAALELLAHSHLRIGEIDKAVLRAKQLKKEFPSHVLSSLLQQILKVRQ